jgi:hypothetical protein
VTRQEKEGNFKGERFIIICHVHGYILIKNRILKYGKFIVLYVYYKNLL